MTATNHNSETSSTSTALAPFRLEQPGELQLSPFGLFAHSKGFQRVDRAAAGILAKNFNSFLAKLGRRFAGVPIYAGHPDVPGYENSYTDRKAYGWIMNLLVREDGLYGEPKWSEAGYALIANGHYKFLSPFWEAVRTGTHNGRPVFSPARLISVGLTNEPNLPMLPLANALDAPADSSAALLGLSLPLSSEEKINRRDAENAENETKDVLVPHLLRSCAAPPSDSAEQRAVQRQDVETGQSLLTSNSASQPTLRLCGEKNLQRENEFMKTTNNGSRTQTENENQTIEMPNEPHRDDTAIANDSGNEADPQAEADRAAEADADNSTNTATLVDALLTALKLPGSVATPEFRDLAARLQFANSSPSSRDDVAAGFNLRSSAPPASPVRNPNRSDIPLANQVTAQISELERRITDLNDRFIRSLLDNAIAEARILPAELNHWRAELNTSFDEASARLANEKPKLNLVSRTENLPHASPLPSDPQQKSKRIQGIIKAKMTADNLSYDEAWAELKSENPGLFAR